MLDAFCYTGGFGLHAAKAGATSVECVDVSESALAQAADNAKRNGLGDVSFVRADVFKYLDDAAQAGRKFGLVVLDPPKFARSRSSIEEAFRGYRRLQTLGVRLLEPDGYLVTCCCSGLIVQDDLNEILAQVAAAEKRDVQILSRTGPAMDHPVSASCLESGYLKCFVSRLN